MINAAWTTMGTIITINLILRKEIGFKLNAVYLAVPFVDFYNQTKFESGMI